MCGKGGGRVWGVGRVEGECVRGCGKDGGRVCGEGGGRVCEGCVWGGWRKSV